MAGLLPPVVAELVAKTGEFTSKLGEARGEMSKTTSHGQAAFHGLASVGKAALLGIGGAAVVAGAFGLEMADKYEVAHARLVTALTNTNTSYAAQKGAIDAVVKSGTAFGYNQAQIEDALAVMTRGTGSSQKAIGLLGLAQDLAAAKGIGLSDAALLVTKASEGQIKPLKALGLDLPFAAAGAVKLAAAHTALSKAQDAQHLVQQKVADGLLKGLPAFIALSDANHKVADAQAKVNAVASTGSGIIDALGKKLAGSAAGQADTFKGKVDALKAQLDNLGIKIGMWLIPKLEQLATTTQHVITWMEKHQTVAKALAIIIGTVLVAAVAAYTASMISAAAATIAATWPFLAVGAVVVGLVAGLIYLWTHWDQVWNWISHHKAYAAIIAIVAPIIVGFFALIAVLRYLSANWSAIWSGIQTVIKDAVGGVEAAVRFLMGIPSVIANAWHALPGLIMSALDAMPDLLRNLGHLAVQGLLLGAKLAWKAALAFFIGIPTLILLGIGDLNRLLIKAGTAAIHGLWNGAVFYFTTFLPWVASIPGKILAALPGAISWLYNVGVAVLRGLLNGMVAAAVAILHWLPSLPGEIVHALGDLGSILYDAGKQILHGLWEGMKAAWHDLTGWLGGLGHAITKLKGPPAVDAVLLHNNGLLIMDGFRKGLEQGWKGVQGDLAGMTGHIGGLSGAHGVAGFGASRGQGSIVINIDLRGSVGLDEDKLSRVVVDAASRWYRRNGPLPFAVSR